MLLLLHIALSAHLFVAVQSAKQFSRVGYAANSTFWYGASVAIHTGALAAAGSIHGPLAMHAVRFLDAAGLIGAAVALGVLSLNPGVARPGAIRGSTFVAAGLAALTLGTIHATGMWNPASVNDVEAALWLVGSMITVVNVLRARIDPEYEPIWLHLGTLANAAIALRDMVEAMQGGTTMWRPVGFLFALFAFTLIRASEHTVNSFRVQKQSAAPAARAAELEALNRDLQAAKEEIGRTHELAAVGELAAVIAHEVRNPLAVISNAVAGLRKPLPKADHEMLLAIVDEETHRLNRIVTDLLRYARPINLQQDEIDLSELLERVLYTYRTNPGLAITLEVNGKHPHVFGDPTLLRQVFDNLCENATQAMSGNGELRIRVEANDDEVSVIITDSGVGMDTQILRRAKDPFFTTRPSGTGLGLAIVERIVEAHTGTFTIASHPGEGTTVRVSISQRARQNSTPVTLRRTSVRSETQPQS